MVPSFATAPVLVIVGALMFSNVKELRLENVKDVIPTFLTIILIPLTFSITQGILWGLFSHSVLSVFSKDRSAIRGSELVLGGLALILLIVENQG